MRIYLENVGCRLNWSEIERLARQFIAAGHAIVRTPVEADVILVNTCAVTAQAERKTRHNVRSLYRDNPDARIGVIGCYPTLRPERSANFPGVSWVIDNAEKSHAFDIVAGTSMPPSSREPGPEEMGTLRTRAFVKVQDGCDNHCTYCIIRSLRGPSQSRRLPDIVREVQMLAEEADCQEAVLTGASLGAYGRDLGLSDGLRELIETVLAKTDLPRLRLSSVEPWDLDESFFDLWQDSRLCRQIHVPLQSGCDKTLRRMGRPITTEKFATLVQTARAAIPDIAVTTDVMVGFPGEDRDAFHESYEFVRRMAFAKVHVFPYSPRPGTPATKLADQVSRQVRDERARQMRVLGSKQRRTFQQGFSGRQMNVLWEKQWRDGRWTGWTDNYIRVVARVESNLYNQITPARLLELKNGYFEGEAIG